MTLFGDDRRGLKLFAGFGVLLALGAYYTHIAVNLEAGWRWCMADPLARDGSRLVFPLWEVTGIEGPDRYRISKIVKDIPVVGDATALKLGDTVSVDGTFDGRARVVRERVREVHTLRPYKEALGMLGFVLSAAAAPFFFRWRAGRLRERPWPT